MTALEQYQRLESTGLWRESADEQRREVIVSVGEASLVISDKAERILTHWSLPALIRQNPGVRPAIYRPGPDSNEDIELDDAQMIDAIERVRRAVEKGRAHPGRVRGGAVLLTVGVLVLFSVLWLPPALTRYTASVVPPAKSAELGRRLLDQIVDLAGGQCSTGRAKGALERLAARLRLEGSGRITVLEGGSQPTLHLPGGYYLVNRTLVEDFETGEVLAGFLLAEDLRARGTGPLERMLDAVGTRATFTLMTTGDLAEEHLRAYAEELLTSAADAISSQHLLAAFAAASVPSTPYALALDVTGETSVELIEADPFAGGGAQPLMSDGDWISLQEICGG
jgi:hypothetical protein